MSAPLPRVAAVVVNYNGKEVTLQAVESLRKMAYPNFDLVVLDNASTDGSVEAVRERFPDARVIALDSRTGKAENDSTLLAEAKGEYCLLLNEDAELQPGAVEALLEALDQDADAGVAGAQLMHPDGTPQQ